MCSDDIAKADPLSLRTVSCTQTEMAARIDVGNELRGIDGSKWEEVSIAEDQMGDSEISEFYHLVKNGSLKPRRGTFDEASRMAMSLFSIFNLLEMRDDVLVRRREVPGNGTVQYQVVVPNRLRDKVVGLCHAPNGGDHHNLQETMYKVQCTFYWPGWSADVSRHLRLCPCQMRGEMVNTAKVQVGSATKGVIRAITAPASATTTEMGLLIRQLSIGPHRQSP